jgi:hypothetical protein
VLEKLPCKELGQRERFEYKLTPSGDEPDQLVVSA